MLLALPQLGWQPFFQQQLSLDEWGESKPARVIEQHRSELKVATEEGEVTVLLQASMPEMVVGDWLLLDADNQFDRLLDRKTLFARKAAGTKIDKQLISANVDTAFIMSSMNDDFNLSRIERFLALANEADAEPVVILTKADLTEDPDSYVQQVQAIDQFLSVIAINGLDTTALEKLSPWLKTGATVALLGSSGVGKSTLANTLLGEQTLATGGIREDDSKGKHTTTSRSLNPLPSGALILDTPGMRELQLADNKEGISKTFADIEALAEQCKFNDCSHNSEPGCAVQKAIQSGELDLRRFNNYQKLLREEALNSASLAERRSNDKALHKFYKSTQSEAAKLKGR